MSAPLWDVHIPPTKFAITDRPYYNF